MTLFSSMGLSNETHTIAFYFYNSIGNSRHENVIVCFRVSSFQSESKRVPRVSPSEKSEENFKILTKISNLGPQNGGK